MKRETYVICVLDRSGSMLSIKDDVIGGFNTFVREQKALPGDARLRLVQFDTIDAQEVVYDGPMHEAPFLSPATYQPRGGTPLNDALGMAISQAGHALEALPPYERPDNVIVSVITDGQENSSREYSKAKVRAMIAHQEKVYNWKFVFIGVGIDAFAESAGYGLHVGQTMGVAHDAHGTRKAFMAYNSAVTNSRSSADGDMGAWKPEDMPHAKEVEDGK